MAELSAAERAALYEKLIAYNRENSGFNRHNGLKIVELDAGYCKVEVQLTRESLNPLGCAHGALVFALGDVCTGMAAAAAGGRRVLTQCASINFLRPGMGSRLTAIGREVRTGRQTGVYDAEIFNDEGKLVAKGSFTAFFTDGLEAQSGKQN